MKYIDIDLTQNKVRVPNKTIGKQGESFASGIRFTLQPEYSGWSVFVDIETPDGEKSRIQLADVRDNVAIYEVSGVELENDGRLKLDLILSNGVSIIKPFSSEFTIKKAICAENPQDGVIPIILTSDMVARIEKIEEDAERLNYDIVGKLSESIDGQLMFDGVIVGSDIDKELDAQDIEYSNEQILEDSNNLKEVLDELVDYTVNSVEVIDDSISVLYDYSHNHDNDNVLKMLHDNDGVLHYKGLPINGGAQKIEASGVKYSNELLEAASESKIENVQQGMDTMFEIVYDKITNDIDPRLESLEEDSYNPENKNILDKLKKTQYLGKQRYVFDEGYGNVYALATPSDIPPALSTNWVSNILTNPDVQGSVSETDHITTAGLRLISKKIAKVNETIFAQTHWRFELVETLPETGEENVIYLVPNTSTGENVYDEYIFVNEAFEIIGNTAVNVSNCITKEEFETFKASLDASGVKYENEELKGIVESVGINAELTDVKQNFDILISLFNQGINNDIVPRVTKLEENNYNPSNKDVLNDFADNGELNYKGEAVAFKKDIPEGGSEDLSNYYTKNEIDKIISGLSVGTVSLENASVEIDDDGSGIIVAGGAVE